MDNDIETCYRAVKARDARFDGRFFTAVVSTGVFCRPVCPAATPKKANCRFYPHAAAAMAAGFRPCLRCRPEAAPGTPAWNGVSATVTRALRLIQDGALDEGTVEDLAGRLGMGGRHLRRLFLDHVGAGPKAVAETRRLLFAKKLITESDLPLTVVALSSGFGSIRRFNGVFREVYGRPPRDLRRENRAAAAADTTAIAVRLPYRPPYAWQAMVGFLGTRAIPGVEEAGEWGYRRTIRLGGAGGSLEVRPEHGANHLVATVHLADIAHLHAAVGRAQRVFDVDANTAEIDAHLGRDDALAAGVAVRPGLRIPGAWDPFELSVRAVLGQQISVAAARTLAGRLVRAFGEPLDGPAESALTHLFPTPAVLAEADLSGIGLTRRRAATLNGLAGAFAGDEFDLAAAAGLADIEARLCALPGIGRWTAQYIAMRALGEPDAFPHGDLGLLRAMAARGEELDTRGLARRAEAWRPWRAYAAMHLWMGGTS